MQAINLLPRFRCPLLRLANLQDGIAVQTAQLAQAGVERSLLHGQVALSIIFVIVIGGGGGVLVLEGGRGDSVGGGKINQVHALLTGVCGGFEDGLEEGIDDDGVSHGACSWVGACDDGEENDGEMVWWWREVLDGFLRFVLFFGGVAIS